MVPNDSALSILTWVRYYVAQHKSSGSLKWRKPTCALVHSYTFVARLRNRNPRWWSSSTNSDLLIGASPEDGISEAYDCLAL